MNKTIQILLSIILLTSVYSCSKDDGIKQEEEQQKEQEEVEGEEEDDNQEEEESFTITMEAISAKWVVDESDVYESLEFNESGSYIIVKSDLTKSTTNNKVLFGSYTINEDGLIVLSDFGSIEVIDLAEDKLKLTITLEGASEELVIEASKQAEMESNDKTEQLCRTWKLVTLDGVEVAGTDMEFTVLFSKAGTYFVDYTHPTEIFDGLASWKWADAEQSVFLYSWEKPAVWSDEFSAEITELTENSLIVEETIIDEGTTIAYLVPINQNVPNQSSNELVSTQSFEQLKSGLFKR